MENKIKATSIQGQLSFFNPTTCGSDMIMQELLKWIMVCPATLTFLHITSLAFQLTRIFFNKMMIASHPSYDSPKLSTF